MSAEYIKTIQEISELPNWFDAKKYQAVKDLDSYGWEKQLSVRKYLQFKIEEVYSFDDMERFCVSTRNRPLSDLERLDLVDKVKEIEAKRVNDLEDTIEKIQNNPIVDMKKFDFVERVEEVEDEREHQPYNQQSVKSLSVREVFRIINKSKHLGDKFDVWKACSRMESAEDWALAWSSYDLFLKKNGQQDGPCHLTVNLSANDEQLLNDFKKWLKHYRELINKTNTTKIFKKLDFDKWYVKRILPYIDLMLWSKINNISITQKVLGDAIFFDEPKADTTERIRKTTMPAALKALSSSTLLALEHQNMTDLRTK